MRMPHLAEFVAEDHARRTASGDDRRFRLPVLAAGLLALALGTASAPSAGAQQVSRAELVQALLGFAAEDIDGNAWTHDDLEGRIVLIDFWATWCAPCLAELPYLKRARSRYGDDFEVVGISLDTGSRRHLLSWLARQRVDWPQIHADGGFEDDLALAFGIDRLPTNLLLDRHGRLRALNVRGERLFVEVDRLLAEEGSRPR